MNKLLIEGGSRIGGTVRIAGAKNAALPILAATILAPGEHRIGNVPDLLDISSMLSLLGRIGCPSLLGSTLRLDTKRIVFCEAPYDLVRKMRASVLALGPLLARMGEAHVSLPGGCAIGVRPIDQHLKGLEAMGCRFELKAGYVHGWTDGLRGARIHLDVPTVTGTENILMAATLARGHTTIDNAAREPEIVDLACFLRSLGARIRGEGTQRIEVDGVETLSSSSRTFHVMPDRIEAGTYLVAAAITRGNVTITNVVPQHMQAILDALRQAGSHLEIADDSITLSHRGPVQPIDLVTSPYPGFPTDMQAQFMALLTLARGTSRITETIFENRFMHAAEFLRLGADLEISGNRVKINGVRELFGASLMATDLRASAGLVLAALASRGRSEVLRLYHLDRGYEKLVEKLQSLGARLRMVESENHSHHEQEPMVVNA